MKIIILYLKKNNPDIALIVLHIDVDIEIFQNIDENLALVQKSIKQSDVSKQYFEREKRLFCY